MIDSSFTPFLFLIIEEMAHLKFYYPYDTIALKHIDQSIVELIIQAYQRGDQLQKIKSDFPNVPITNSLYVNLPYELTRDKCICGNSIYRKTPCRTASLAKLDICPSCGHDEGLKKCLCPLCTKNRADAEKREKEAFRKRWNDHLDSVSNFINDFQALDLNDVLNLSILFTEKALIRYDKGLVRFSSLYTPAEDETNKQRHFDKISAEVCQAFRSLVDRRILIPDQKLSDLQIAQIRTCSDFSKISWDLVNWRINLHEANLQTECDVKLLTSQRQYTKPELEVLWHELYFSELEQYVNESTNENLGFVFSSIEVSTISDSLSENYSIAKAFSLIAQSISLAIRFQILKTPTEKALRTYLIKTILGIAERRKSDQHLIKSLERPSQLYFSIKSRLIAYGIFKLSTSYFTLSKTIVLNALSPERN